MNTTISIYKNKIFKHVKAFKPDIVHNQTNGPIGQLGRYTAKRLDIPFVFTYHKHFEEYAPYVEPGFINRIARAKERRYLQRMANISTEFIAPSIKIKNYLRKKGVDKYINVISTGVNVKDFECDESVKKDHKHICKKYGIDEKDKILIFVGGLSEEKNIDLLLKCFATYLHSETALPTKLLIVGDGDQIDTLKQLISELDIEDKVIFVGKVNHDRIKTYLDLADVFVTASTSETQNISAMEAMSSRCLVLLKEDEALMGFIERDQNGFTFNDDVQFAYELNRIFSLSEKEIEKVKKSAYKTILNDFSLENYYQRIMEVYDRAKRKIR